MESRQETNELIDWSHGNKKSREQRKGYLKILRKFLTDLESIPSAEVTSLLKKWNVYFIDCDEFERVNLDEPK